MRPRLCDRLHHLCHDVRRGRQVRVAHTKIDDVGATGTRGGLQPVHLGEDVRRQALDAMEILDHVPGLFRLAEMGFAPQNGPRRTGSRRDQSPRLYARAAPSVQSHINRPPRSRLSLNILNELVLEKLLADTSSSFISTKELQRTPAPFVIEFNPVDQVWAP